MAQWGDVGPERETHKEQRRARVERIMLEVGALLMAGVPREEIARRLGMTAGQGVRIYEAKFWRRVFRL